MNPIQLAVAFGLDLVFGDPKWLPHPVRMIGRTAAVLETALRRWFVGEKRAAGFASASAGCGGTCLPAGRSEDQWCVSLHEPPQINVERVAGAILTITVVLSSYGMTWFLIIFSGRLHTIVEWVLTTYLCYTVLAVKSLGDEAQGVFKRLREGDIVSARRWLSRIVGRETDQLSEPGVIRATVETVAENSSDGVVAPLFYLVLGGPPLAMAYKAINTLDSMVGYRTPRYRNFGWASARLDDLANYLPARITGLLMVLGAGLLFGQARPAWKIMRRDGRKHDSPNAGIPEAAAAGALGIQVGGPSRYSGLVKEEPWLGDAVNDIRADHITRMIRLMRAVSFMMLILCLMALSVF